MVSSGQQRHVARLVTVDHDGVSVQRSDLIAESEYSLAITPVAPPQEDADSSSDEDDFVGGWPEKYEPRPWKLPRPEVQACGRERHARGFR